MNPDPDHRPKIGHPDLLYWVLGHRKKLCVHYLCKLLAYDHQICTIGAYHMGAQTDTFTLFDLFKFTGLQI